MSSPADKRRTTNRAARGTTPTGPRSTPKREAPPRKPRTAHTAADRDRALEAMQREGAEGGIAGAHRLTGIPKGTLSRWAQAAGIDLGAKARRRTAAATATVEAKAAEVRVTTVDRLERILERELDVLERRADLELLAERLVADSPVRYVTTIAGERPEPADEQARDAVARLRMLAEANPKRDTVGAATRAVHDLQLLKGDATERGAIVVRFGIPRSSALEADLEAVDEADLGGAP